MPNFASEFQTGQTDSPAIERLKAGLRQQFHAGEWRAHVETRLTPELRTFLATSGLYVDHYPETDENYEFIQVFIKPQPNHTQPGIYRCTY